MTDFWIIFAAHVSGYLIGVVGTYIALRSKTTNDTKGKQMIKCDSAWKGYRMVSPTEQ